MIAANENKKNACVVILGEQPKEEIEEAVASHISDTKTTRIVCRSGSFYETYALARCSVETSKSVIVNVDDDAETVKILLALSAYVRDKKLTNPQLRFVSALQDRQYLEAATIAGEGRAEIVYAKDAIARIIANTCRQHGLSQVLTELFNYGGDELYFENVPELTGKTFREALMSFSNAVVFGLYADGQVYLNPPMDTLIQRDDQLILLEEDDGVFMYHQPKTADETKISDGGSIIAKASDHMIVLGSNEELPIILTEYDKYVDFGTKVIIVDDDFEEEKLDTYSNLEISICKEPITRDLLCGFMERKADNILLLNDDSQDWETADSQTLLRLILLRDIADKTGQHLSITTEMRNVENQRLASRARVDDFVIGSNFISLLMTQISENPKIVSLIEDILDENGSELYMKPVADYVTVGEPVNSYTLTESAARKGEIFVGYRQLGNNVIVNPNKEEVVIFGKDDQIVVVAED